MRTQQQSASDPNEIWMITLTDLLNVLLCFFVFHAALNSHIRPQPTAPAIVPLKQVPAPEQAKRLELQKGIFTEHSDVLTFTGAEQVRAFARSALKPNQTIQVKFLFSPLGGAVENLDETSSLVQPTWRIARDRTLAVARQLIDAGVDPSSISTEAYATSKLSDNERSLGIPGDFYKLILSVLSSPLEQKSAFIVQESTETHSEQVSGGLEGEFH